MTEGSTTVVPRTGPALGLIEVASVARGMVVADAMVKKALITLVQANPVTPGKYVVVIAGGEEEVSQSMDIGLELASDTLVDSLYLPKADSQLAPAIATQQVQVDEVQALGILETFSVASCVLAGDRAVKGAMVQLVQMRLARGLGGKAFFVLTGQLHQVEAGVEAGRGIIHDGMLPTSEIIPRPHADFVRAVLSQGVY